MATYSYTWLSYGQILILLSQAWKCFKIANSNNDEHIENDHFTEGCVNLKNNVRANRCLFSKEFFYGLGALLFTIAALLMRTASDSQVTFDIILCLIGGVFYVVSALLLIHHYFFSDESKLYFDMKNDYNIIS